MPGKDGMFRSKTANKISRERSRRYTQAHEIFFLEDSDQIINNEIGALLESSFQVKLCEAICGIID